MRAVNTIWSGIFICLLSTVGFLLPPKVQAKDKVIFSHPEKENHVFTRSTTENITGIIVSKEILTDAQISFDGGIWRELNLVKTSDGYNFSYVWTVSGKGNFFILVEATDSSGGKVEGRILCEVYVPPEQEEAGLKELLYDYQKEQEKKQQKATKANEDNKPDVFTSLEFFAEDYIGGFIEKDYMVLLPTNDQFTFFMNSTVTIYHFIKTYQAGIDIFFLITLPLIIILSIGLILFVIIDYANEFTEFLYAYWHRSRNLNPVKSAILFEVDSLHRVSNAKVLFENIDTRRKFYLPANRIGQIDLTNIPDGEYYYSVFKHGYKEQIINDITGDHFNDRPIAKNNYLMIDGTTKIALPAESTTNLERKKIFEKSNLFYRPKMWFLRNLSSGVTLGTLTMLLYALFINLKISIVISIYYILCYLIYILTIKRQNNWGRVLDVETGNAITDLKVELYKNDSLYEVVWTDFDGRYVFENIGDGIYHLSIDNNYHIVKKEGYYDGEKFCVAGNGERKINRNILVKR